MQACPHPDDPEHVHLAEPKGSATAAARISILGRAALGQARS
jgi:hypothetical protein